MGAAGDADGFVVDLQTDGTGELALQALSRCGCSGSILLLMLLSELSSGHKTAEHRHYEHRALAQDKPPTTGFRALTCGRASNGFQPRRMQHLTECSYHRRTRRCSVEVNITW